MNASSRKRVTEPEQLSMRNAMHLPKKNLNEDKVLEIISWQGQGARLWQSVSSYI